MLNIIVYIVIINKCDKIPAFLYLAKHGSLIVLFIPQKYPFMWQRAESKNQRESQ